MLYCVVRNSGARYPSTFCDLRAYFDPRLEVTQGPVQILLVSSCRKDEGRDQPTLGRVYEKNMLYRQVKLVYSAARESQNEQFT